MQKGRAAEAARPLFLLSAVSVAARAASAAGAADAGSAGLFGAVNRVARAAQDGGDERNDDQIHFYVPFLARFASPLAQSQPM